VKTARDALKEDKLPQDIKASLTEYIWKKEYNRAILYEMPSILILH
jgi:hypothetical protein